jgi:hypothetical protein
MVIYAESQGKKSASLRTNIIMDMRKHPNMLSMPNHIRTPEMTQNSTATCTGTYSTSEECTPALINTIPQSRGNAPSASNPTAFACPTLSICICINQCHLACTARVDVCGNRGERTVARGPASTSTGIAKFFVVRSLVLMETGEIRLQFRKKRIAAKLETDVS